MSIINSYPLLTQEEIQTAKRLSALLATKGYGAANALYELLSGSAAPGGQHVLFRPHDHCLVGTPLARSSQWSFARAENGSWQILAALSGTWYHISRTGLPDTIAHAEGIADLLLYVTPGIDSESTNVGGANPCALAAKIAINASAGTTQVRFWNRTTGTASSAASTSTTGSVAQLAVQDIPCRGGQWNEIDIEFQSTSAGATISLVDVNIAETRGVSQPQSLGSTTLTSASKP